MMKLGRWMPVLGLFLLGQGCLASAGEVKALKNKVRYLETQVSRLKGKYRALDEAYQNLKSRITSLEKKYEALYEYIKPDTGRLPPMPK